MNIKYELTDETKNFCGITLHRIRALRDIPSAGVKSGDLGGWIEKESNLSKYDNAWVYGDAKVCDNAEVCGNAEVMDLHSYAIYKNSWSSGRWFTYTHSNKKWAVGCFYGTGEELIKKAYADSELSGKCYEAIVRTQEAIDKAIEEAKEAK